jgi:hypothetical protein
MAARRLLIVMLILLGVSTLAAALVPPRSLREGTNEGTNSTTATQPTQTATVVSPPPTRHLSFKIVVGGHKLPVIACANRKDPCRPIRVGDQLSLRVFSRRPAELEIPEFGLVGAASPVSPARFELLPELAGTFGILVAGSRKVVARIQVAGEGKPGSKPGNKAKGPKSGARAGSEKP